MADILDYCRGLKTVTFESGEMILPEGVTSGKLYVLKEGQVEVQRRDTQVTLVDEPGSVFGEMSVLLDQPTSAVVRALSSVQAYEITEAMAFLMSKPEIAIHIATLLARRLYYTTAYLVDLQQQAAGKREDLDLVDRILGTLLRPEDDEAAGTAASGGR
jgi:CRP/FNR family cyclic AMP-dependent transcriptional regulator